MARRSTARLGIWLLLACGAAGFLAGQTAPSTTGARGAPAVYACGWVMNGPAFSACYWRDGQFFALEPRAAEGQDSYARAIAVSGDHVYVAGDYSDGRTLIPCCWIDGKRVELQGGAPPLGATATCIALSGDAVVIGGTYSDGTSDHPCYWEKGIRVELDEGRSCVDAELRSIAVADGTVYACGSLYVGPNRVGCLWNDGVLKKFARYFQPEALCIGGRGPAIVGADLAKVAVWDGATLRDLPVDSILGDRHADAIAFSEGGLLLAGYHRLPHAGTALPCLWRGDRRVDLPVPEGQNGYACSISVAGGSVFVGGFHGLMSSIPCYWRDGTLIDLPCPEDDARVTAIFAEERDPAAATTSPPGTPTAPAAP